MSIRFHPEAAAALREAIDEAGGVEVFAIGDVDDRRRVRTLEIHCRGTGGAVPALLGRPRAGQVVIHNHPSGHIEPSAADFELAARYGDEGVGVVIVDSAVTRDRWVVEPATRAAAGAALEDDEGQGALCCDSLFLKVYGASWNTVDTDVLHPLLTDVLQCEDNPTFMAFGLKDRPGRLAVSPRDFARFGWLYLNEGNWNGRQVISRKHARMAVRNPLPGVFPRTRADKAEMIPGQRSIGSRSIPDDQTDHFGSYSWLWWLNGVDRNGRRRWPNVPVNVFTALGHANGQRGIAAVPDLDLVIAWNDTTLGQRPSFPHPLDTVFRQLMLAAKDEPMPGQVMVNPSNRSWLAWNRDRNHDGRPDPVLLCGPGDPEDFLYRGKCLPDGTREGDQDKILDKMKGTGANCLYLEIIRSHGGDGDETQNPFVEHDPAKGVNENILAQWEKWFTRMDAEGIVPLVFIYDDSACVWDTGDTVGEAERAFLETVVNRFEHHLNLVWCVAEEYSERYTPARVHAIAEVIRAADEHQHPIAVHNVDGLSFAFAEDPVIDQFAIQYNKPDALSLHQGVCSAWKSARGRYSLNLAEAAGFGTGGTALRKMWAAAMGGASVMALGWTFDRPDIPARSDLEACGNLVRFFALTPFDRMAPHDELAAGDTRYVLAQPGTSCILYSDGPAHALGIRKMKAGTGHLVWLKPENGRILRQERVRFTAGTVSFPVPEAFREGPVAVWVERNSVP